MADARRCPSCGAKHRDFRTRCLRCGTPLDTGPDRPTGRTGWAVGAGLAALVSVGVVAWTVAAPQGRARVLSGKEAPVVPPSRAVSAPGDVPAPPDGGGPDVQAFDPTPLATAAYERGDLGAALLGFQRAMAEHPDDPAAMNNVGQVLVRLGRAPEAVSLFERAAAARPGEWSYRFNLARARGLVGDWPGAVESYREAERLFPDDGPTLYNLGLALQHTGADPEAAEVLARAVSASPDDAAFVLALARSQQRLSRTAEARAGFERFLELAPQSAEAAAARQAIASLDAAPAPGSPSAGEPKAPPAPEGRSRLAGAPTAS
jgi:Flp pilus assembly protein TadD